MNHRFEDDFIPSVRDWCQLHADKVCKCYAAAHQGYPSVFVIRSPAKRNRAPLGQPMVDLGNNLRRQGWQCSLLQIPSEHSDHYDAFLELEKAVLVYPSGQ